MRQQSQATQATTEELAEATVLNITSLALARALPLVPPEAKGQAPTFAPGSIERFAAADQSQFDIVLVDGVPHAQPASEPTVGEPPAEA